MKAFRQKKILDIIANEIIDTQELLSERLRESGFDVTQATVSRDIKELRLIKVMADEGVYHYAAAGNGEAGISPNLRNIFRASVTGCDTAGHLVVLKTLPGLASAACSALDAMRIDGLVGTLAGDDTAFLALKTSDDADGLKKLIMEILI